MLAYFTSTPCFTYLLRCAVTTHWLLLPLFHWSRLCFQVSQQQSCEFSAGIFAVMRYHARIWTLIESIIHRPYLKGYGNISVDAEMDSLIARIHFNRLERRTNLSWPFEVKERRKTRDLGTFSPKTRGETIFALLPHRYGLSTHVRRVSGRHNRHFATFAEIAAILWVKRREMACKWPFTLKIKVNITNSTSVSVVVQADALSWTETTFSHTLPKCCRFWCQSAHK